MSRLIVILLFCNFIIGCQDNRPRYSEISDSINILDSLIYQEYIWLKSIEGYHNRDRYVDSIYLIGNQLIEDGNFDSPLFLAKYQKFSKECRLSNFKINNAFSPSYIISKIKLLQYHALNQERIMFYESHYQVDAMGFRIINNQIKKGKKERIYIVPNYFDFQFGRIPIFVINNDTLQYDNYHNRYYYDILANEKDTLILKAKITVWRWDGFLTIDAAAPLYVK